MSTLEPQSPILFQKDLEPQSPPSLRDILNQPMEFVSPTPSPAAHAPKPRDELVHEYPSPPAGYPIGTEVFLMDRATGNNLLCGDFIGTTFGNVEWALSKQQKFEGYKDTPVFGITSWAHCDAPSVFVIMNKFFKYPGNVLPSPETSKRWTSTDIPLDVLSEDEVKEEEDGTCPSSISRKERASPSDNPDDSTTIDSFGDPADSWIYQILPRSGVGAERLAGQKSLVPIRFLPGDWVKLSSTTKRTQQAKRTSNNENMETDIEGAKIHVQDQKEKALIIGACVVGGRRLYDVYTELSHRHHLMVTDDELEEVEELAFEELVDDVGTLPESQTVQMPSLSACGL